LQLTGRNPVYTHAHYTGSVQQNPRAPIWAGWKPAYRQDAVPNARLSKDTTNTHRASAYGPQTVRVDVRGPHTFLDARANCSHSRVYFFLFEVTGEVGNSEEYLAIAVPGFEAFPRVQSLLAQ
jgi:hypothetical protein